MVERVTVTHHVVGSNPTIPAILFTRCVKVPSKNIQYKEVNGCHLCTSHYRNKDGYHNIVRNKRKTLVHRAVYEDNFGPIPEGMVIRHSCDNTSCINPEHLILGTHQDNVNDRVQRNRSALGSNNGRSVLTEEDVISIRADTTSTQKELGKKYGVNPKTISDIKRYKLWKNV